MRAVAVALAALALAPATASASQGMHRSTARAAVAYFAARFYPQGQYARDTRIRCRTTSDHRAVCNLELPHEYLTLLVVVQQHGRCIDVEDQLYEDPDRLRICQ